MSSAGVKQGICDKDAFLKAGEQGLLCMWADEKYGGLGIEDFRFEQIVIEETMRHGDLGLFLTLHSRLVGPYIGHLGSEALKERLLPKCISGETILGIAMTEPGAGSDLAGMKVTGRARWRRLDLNGSKTYISNGINGGAFVVAARTVPGQAAWYWPVRGRRRHGGLQPGPQPEQDGPQSPGYRRTVL